MTRQEDRHCGQNGNKVAKVHGFITADRIANLPTRQRAVAELIAGHLTPRQVADRLGIQISTVNNTLGAICDKLGLLDWRQLRPNVGEWDAPADLPERQRQVLGLLLADRSYYEIAAELDVTYNTARTHVHRLYRRVKVESRAELVEKFVLGRRVSAINP